MKREQTEYRPLGRRDAGEWAAWVLVLLMAALLGASLTWSERNYTVTLEQQRMTEQTRVIGQNLVRQLAAVRSVLDNVRGAIQREDGCDDACRHAAVHALRGAMPGVRAILLADRGGHVLFADAEAGAGGPDPRRLVGGLGEVEAPAMLYLSAQAGAAPGAVEVRAAIPFASRAAAPAGAVGAAEPAPDRVLVAILDPAYFDVVMRSALYAPDMTSAVTNDDDTQLLFVPYDQRLPWYDAAGHRALHARHLASGLQSSIMRGRLGANGEERLVAQRSVDAGALKLDRMLVVGVSRSMDAVGGPARRLGWEFALAWTALASAGSAVLHFRQRRRRLAHAIRLREQAERDAVAERIELALGGANLGLWDWHLGSGCFEIDARGLAMLGYAASERLPACEDWPQQVHPDDRGAIERALALAQAPGKGFEAEDRVRHRSGGWVWILSRGKVVERDAAGLALRLVGTRMDISARKQAEADIVRLAFYDGLTGLPNRRLLLDRLTQSLAKAERSRWFGAAMFLDLDNFKGLNDTLGHQVGDKLLERVAVRLQGVTRDTDTVARLGGDEFVVLLDNLGTSRADAEAHAGLVAAKIVHALALHHTIDGHDIRSTPSVGIALFGPATHAVDDLLKQADMAMYEAKASGRNGFRFFDPEMQASIDRSVTLDADLRHAVTARQFALFYQPVLDQACALQGVEALVRWRHPRRGLVAPCDFIAQAEKSDLILDIGEWVLQEACRQLAAWAHSPRTRALTMAVNISARQLRQPGFVERVMQTLAVTGARPSLLKLELTESMLLGDVADIVGKMHALKALGVGFALDDFGTGYSSLSYLERLPIAQLKIDRSFVSDMLVTPNAATIVRAIVTLGHNLGLEVVAEGVENECQRLALLECGCHRFQGYLFSPPVAPGGLAPWLDEAPALACG
jgi:diguanylate cyclase (GGDEF)-like protein